MVKKIKGYEINVLVGFYLLGTVSKYLINYINTDKYNYKMWAFEMYIFYNYIIILILNILEQNWTKLQLKN